MKSNLKLLRRSLCGAFIGIGMVGCGVSIHPDSAPTDSVVIDQSQAGSEDGASIVDADSIADATDDAATDAELLRPIPTRLSLLNYGPAVLQQFPNNTRWEAQAEFFGPTTGSRSIRFSGCYLERVRIRAQMLNPEAAQITVNAVVYPLMATPIGWFHSELGGVPLASNTRGSVAVRGGDVGSINAELMVPSPPTLSAPDGVGSVNAVSYRPLESLTVRWVPEDLGEIALRLRATVGDEYVLLRCFVARSVGRFEITPVHWHALGDAAEIDFAFSGIVRTVQAGVELEGRNTNARRRFRRQP